MANIYVLVQRAANGFGVAVVATSDGDSPYPPMVEWCVRRGFAKYNAAEVPTRYEIVDRIETDLEYRGVIAMCEWWDGDLNIGRGKVTRWRELQHGNY